eukprot:6176134-Pleurochrysis_carterae.AAC.1
MYRLGQIGAVLSIVPERQLSIVPERQLSIVPERQLSLDYIESRHGLDALRLSLRTAGCQNSDFGLFGSRS